MSEGCGNPFHNHDEDGAHMQWFRALRGPNDLLMVPVEDFVRLIDEHASTATGHFLQTQDPRALMAVEMLAAFRGLLVSMTEAVQHADQREEEIDRTVEETLAGGWEDELLKTLQEHAGGTAEPTGTPQQVEDLIDEVREQLDTSETDGPVDEYTAMLERLADEMRGGDNSPGE